MGRRGHRGVISFRNARFQIAFCTNVSMGLFNFFLPLCARNRVRLLILAKAFLSILFFFGADLGHATPPQHQPEALEGPAASSEDRMEIVSITSDRIRGRLTRGSIGIVFDSGKGDATPTLVIRTLHGEELLSVRERGTGIVVAVDDGRLSVQVDQQDLLDLRSAHTDGTLANLLRAPLLELRARLQAITEVHGNADAVQNVQRLPEYALLPSVSWELGKLGITGRRFPPSLAIHAVGLAAARTLQVDPRESGISYRQTLPPEIRPDGDWRAELTGSPTSDCSDPRSALPSLRQFPECPAQCDTSPDPQRDCTGMCGRGCSDCWDWVCGDCCYHNFCAIHDAATRACEEVSDVGFCLLALLPWYFAVLGCE
jgi:hypothetical protein